MDNVRVKHPMDNAEIFFLSVPQNWNSVSIGFRKNSVICIVCLLKLCIQSLIFSSRLASTTVVMSISFTDHGVVCNVGAKLWYVVSRCWTELKAETITLFARLHSELWSIFGASSCSVFSIRWLSWDRMPSRSVFLALIRTRSKQSYRLELEVGLSN